MIIGDNKDKVIENIKQNVNNGIYNCKVEVDDPNISQEKKDEIIENYLNNRETFLYKIKNRIAKVIIAIVTNMMNKDTEIRGLENVENINTGAIITSNHFNPLDSIIIQKFAKKMKKSLYIVAQETNLAMTGIIGFMMKYSNIIPISNKISYMKKQFAETIENTLNKNNLLLIYPEQEMWFNYKKPRPLKTGSYYYAAKNNVPVISCFVEMINTTEKENEQFYKVKYVLHILPAIYPEKGKTVKENANIMMKKDYEQKKQAYEKAYNKKLDYTFEKEDIAGWIC